MSAGMRGASAEQDARFANKQKRLLKAIKVPAALDKKVDMRKVQLNAALKGWIEARLTELLGFEDEILTAFAVGQLEQGPVVEPRVVQMNLQSFLEGHTATFIHELWALLLSAQDNVAGIPKKFLDAEAERVRKEAAERENIQRELAKARRKFEEEARDRPRGAPGGGGGRGWGGGGGGGGGRGYGLGHQFGKA